jgi:Rrf2 family protein
MGLSLTSAGDYAMRAMIHIACLPEGSVVLRSQISEAEAIPSSFTAKILRRLVQARLLDSSRGVHGGFFLARPAGEITMLDVVEAIEGPLELSLCSTDPECCGRSHDCPASLVWPAVQEGLRSALARVTLEALASAPRRNGRVCRLRGQAAQQEAGAAVSPAQDPAALEACG